MDGLKCTIKSKLLDNCTNNGSKYKRMRLSISSEIMVKKKQMSSRYKIIELDLVLSNDLSVHVEWCYRLYFPINTESILLWSNPIFFSQVAVGGWNIFSF